MPLYDTSHRGIMGSMLIISHGPPPNEDEVAAALAAVSSVLAEETDMQHAEPVVAARSAWRAAAILESQGLPAGRSAADAVWGRTARAQRSRRWSKGIIGS